MLRLQQKGLRRKTDAYFKTNYEKFLIRLYEFFKQGMRVPQFNQSALQIRRLRVFPLSGADPP